jgi:hypothetical protein
MEDVCDRLGWHPAIDASEIEVTVTGGEVTLAGTVSDRRAKRLAEDVVEDVSGVKEVHNRLRVNRSPELGATAATPHNGPTLPQSGTTAGSRTMTR